jgi:predicted Zn-dependent protease
MMTTEQEVSFGEQVKTEVEKDLTLVNDPEVVGYVRDVGQKVWGQSPKTPFPVEFYVVADNTLNAFAIPGGSIYVHTGLIEAADDEAELASVIAHEMGHVVRRHSARQVSRQTGIQVVEEIVLGNDTGQATQLVTGLLKQGVMFNYSREDEREADAIGVGTIYRAGYDPMAMYSFFHKLQEQGGSPEGPVSTFFASHPPTSERMNNVLEIVNNLEKKPTERPITDLRRTQARIEELGLVPPAE